MRASSAESKADLILVIHSGAITLLSTEVDFNTKEAIILVRRLEGSQIQFFVFLWLFCLLDRLLLLQLVHAGADHLLRVSVEQLNLLLVNDISHTSGPLCPCRAVFFVRVVSCKVSSDCLNWTVVFIERIVFRETLSLVDHLDLAEAFVLGLVFAGLLGVDREACAQH